MPTDRRQRPLLEDIEPRILYAADTPGAPMASAGLAAAEAQRVQLDAETAAAVAPLSELVFVDTRIEDHATLVASVQAGAAAEGRNVEVILIGEGQDGIALVTDTLAQRSDIAAVHLLGHGESGRMQLGTSTLDGDALLQRAPQIASWGSALTADADLLLYGCDLAADADGRALAEGLAQLTGADVAASTDRTGTAALGGNWVLEMQTGAIQAQLASGMQTQAQWQGVLATYTVTNTNDSGAGSLRQAITDANASGVTDNIGFTIAGTGVHTITLSSALPSITGTVVINGTTDDSFAANGSKPAIVINGNGLNVDGLNLTATADGSTIRGLVIRNFLSPAIRIDAGSDSNSIVGNYLGAVDATGNLAAAANASYTVYIAGANNTIGGSTAADRNVLGTSGAGGVYGLFVSGATASGNQILGNYIGIGANGSTAFSGTQSGISVQSGAASTRIEGNVIAANADDGLYITTSGTGTVIHNNLIGTNAAGTVLASTPDDGIWLAAVGTGTVVTNNVIAGATGSGIRLDAGASGVTVQGNRIGTDAAGTANWGPDQNGILIASSNNLIGGTGGGQGNIVANSNQGATSNDGIAVTSGTGNAILGNSIYGTLSTGLGIDLSPSTVTANDAGDADSGANNLQNFPVLTAAATNASNIVNISGTLNSTASSYFRIELFASPTASASGYGEGRTYLGSVNVVTNASGNASFGTTLSAAVPIGYAISATATKSVAGYASFTDTSEFSQAFTSTALASGVLAVDTVSDVLDGDTTSITTLLASKGADGFISLREAITATNNTANVGGVADRINFAIAGTGVHTITPGSLLPNITGAVVLDASTDDSFAANSNRPAIVLDGNNLAGSGLTLTSTADGSTIRGFVIRDFVSHGIDIQAGSDGNTVAGNYLGRLNTSGTDAGAGEGNDSTGIFIAGANNMIGGTTAADRNVASGNSSTGIRVQGATATGNQIAGNFVGLNATGTAVLGNAEDGIQLMNSASGNTVGGATSAHRNVISGNTDGIQLGYNTGPSNANVIQNNYIGTDVTGQIDLGNTSDGIDLWQSSLNNQILDNVVSGNNVHGLYIGNAAGTSTGTIIRGNLIGVAADGSTALGNGGDGINLGDGAGAGNTVVGGTTAGQGNVVAYNARGIVAVSSTGLTFLGNRVYANTGIGIDLGANGVTANDAADTDNGANNLQNYPVLTLAKTNAAGQIVVSGTLTSTTGTNYYRIEFFASPTGDANGYGEGQVYLGSTNATTASGTVSFSATLAATVPIGYVITATATKSNAAFNAFTDTSEFARNVVAISSAQGSIVVDTAADTSDGDTTSLSTLLANKGADGFVSLREAIIATNNTANGTGGADRITFGIAGTGVHTITAGSDMPTISGAVSIDASTDDSFAVNGSRPAIVLQGNGSGSTWTALNFVAGSSGSTVRGFVIKGFDTGIWLQNGSSGNTIVGNYVGPLTATGNYDNAAAAQTRYGILINSANNTIGGTSTADRNVISGALPSGLGIYIVNATATDNRVIGNYLGTSAAGTPLGLGGESVMVTAGASGNQIGGTSAGEGNLIAGSGAAGVTILQSGTIHNAVLGNNIYGNGDLGINLGASGVTANDAGDADTGPNNLQSFPVLTLATTDGSGQVAVAGTLTTDTGTNYYRIEFFASATADGSGYGEGQVYLGFVNMSTTGGTGSFSTALSAVVPVGYAISATATKSDAAYATFTDTSEFSASLVTTTASEIVVTTAADNNDAGVTAGNAAHTLGWLSVNKGADGLVSLREAIIAANNTVNGAGPDRILFGIAGTGVHTITLGSVLPTITGAVLIDASTDDSFAVNGSRPAIVLDGNNGNFHGLTLSGTSDGSTIRGLVIRNLQQTGIILQAGADGNTIVGNYIGRLGTSGLAESTGLRYGLQVLGANNVIGGTTAADRNVIGGATDNALSPGVGFSGAGILVTGAAAVGNQIIGNYLGVAADGSTVVANDNGIAIDSSATNTLVGGSATNQRNIITGNHRIGLNIDGDATDGTVARGNWIGVNAAGTAAPGNGSTGLFVQNGADNTQVGGAGVNDGNWIANAGASGVQLSGNTALGWIISNTLVQGNRIGTDLAGTADWGSDDEGIFLSAGSTGTRILGNTVAFSGLQGIAMNTTAGTGNSALGNSIYSNTTLGIDLGATGATLNDAGDADTGANNQQNFPVLSQARTNGSGQLLLAGTLNSTASSYYRVEFFATATGDASGYGEGQTYLGFVNVTTNAGGNASFSTTLSVSVPAGYAVSATATKSDAAFATFTDTSEFSAAQAVTGSVVNTVPGPQSIAEEVATAITGISVSAPFAATISTTLAVSNGTLLVSLAGGASIGGGANGSATLTLTGTVTQVNAALATLQYTGAAQYNGSDTLAVSSSDGAGGSDADNVAITVTAVNDAPVITSNGGGATASLSLAENTTAVTTVAASDVDGPALTYSISGGADAALFQIDASTGALSFVTGPNFESPTDAGANNIYDVTVRASDGSLADTQAIAVTVTNVNDAPPVITSNGGGATASVSIAENGTAVSTVTATDADGPPLTYSIAGGADAARFQINSGTGVLTFTSAPDFEAPADAGGNNVYDVTVQVSDGTLADTQAIAVTVTNVNDNSPVITSNGGGAAASLNVAENGTAVTTVTASDADASALTYSISGGTDAALFQIDASTGVLTFVTAPNFESPTDAGANNVYNVTVRVSDGTFTDTQTVGVTVTDVNDNAPVITSNGAGATASVSIAENGTAVTTITSTDADGPAPTYSIAGGADAALFQINSATGVLSFLAARDFESPTDAGADNVYDVTVQASDGSATDTQAIAVTVTNLNDSAPVITSNGAGSAAAINVAENGTAVTTVTATDADGSALTYSISAGADAALFQINASTGALSFVGAPNFENPTDAGANNVYNVTVRVSDGVTADTQNLAVTVTDVNDNAPAITSNGGGAAASISITENGTAVTTVTSTDVDGPAPVYSIAGGADAALFQIDGSTGVLTFASAPDFESPADASGYNVYDVTVQVSDGSATDTQTIAVTVTNVNDNAPVITSNGGGATAAVNVAENTTAVTTVTATDADGSALTYSISGGADAALFQVNASTGALTFLAAPNFEAPADAGGNNVYDVTVRASDGTLTDTQAIAVTVTDANDNAPVITSNGGGASANISIAENGTAVTTVTSTDADGSTPVYSIAGGADAALFQINSSTGVLSFLAARDFESPADAGANNIYDVTVQVSDGALADTQAIAITVTNVNDNAPAITSNGGGATAPINVAENGTAVTTVTALDADGSTLTYSISGGADAALFQINAATGVLSFVTARDFETPADTSADNIYDVTVQVSDGSATDTQAIAVTVTNLNDAAPVITSNGGGATASVSIAENGTAVTTVTSTDADGPTPVYSISGGADAALFQIDSSTGALSFLAARDFENPADAGGNNVYDVTVRASDGSLTDTQAIAVTVTDANDNAPVITSNGGGATTSISIAENGTAVTTVTSTDVDGPAPVYSIAGGADAALFQVNASTGELSFLETPDFENPTDAGANNVYDVTVQASDGSATDTQAIAVTVTNLNDNAPAITSNGAGATAGVNVAENGTAVTTVAATDADGATPTFSIVGGADAALFQINASTGALSFQVAPDFENPQDADADNVYDVTVRASDGSLTDTQAIAVTVTDANDNPPVITSNGGGAAASISIAENGAAVTTVTSTDVDGPAPVYSIAGGADAALFQIDAGTGVLTFASAPDFESPADAGGNNVYDVTVQVSDGTATDTQAIAVTVTNANDNSPVITSNGGGATAAVNVAENTTAVTTVTATDADGAALTYSISGGADAALFQINASTGALTFLAAPNYEAPADVGGNNVYDVTVRATDGSLTDTQAIAVTVTDANDNAPIITSNSGGATASISIAENGTAVTTVTSTDADGPAPAYSIAGGADAARFQIDAGTGVLTFTSAPDFESPVDAGGDNVYDVTVQVSDGSLADTQTIAVTVTNLNDNAPAITSNGAGATAGVNIAELTTAVTTVTAADADGSALTYSISGGADAALFQIDAATGALRFVSAPDFEAPADAGADNVYDVTVQVSDGSATDTQAIAVTVADLNDNAPNITSNGGGASASINVTENTTAVTTVTASDADSPTLTYSISGGADAALFAIDASTGALSFLAAPDHESPQDAGANNVYDVQVQVSDGVLADTQSLAVTVTDLNDNAPVITSNGGGATASLNLLENGTAVTTVAASDADASVLTYSISGGADAARFQIDAATGVLTFVSAPDFESPSDAGADNVYDVIVQASDGSATDTQAIAVTVTNLNDAAPVITSDGGGATAAINVAENGTAVTTVTSTDADGPAPTYSIVGGADAALFQIDAATGALSFLAARNFETPADAGANNVYDVTVQANDGVLADTQAIAVTVTDLNDNAPVITSNAGGATASVSIAENGTAVTTVTSTDADGPAPTYSISGGADAALFQIDSATGVLSFLAAPDFESPADAGADNVYDVTVQVSDGNLSDTQAISITVANLNDNAPVITSGGAGATAIVNAAELATVVTTVTAADADGSALAYAISGGADAALFQIDANTGVLRFLAAPDFENPQDAGADNVYDVIVQVSDGSVADTQAIAVTVTDLNDNGPAITSNGGGAAASVSIAETGTAVTTVTSTDVDGPSPIYSIAGGADAALFQIDGSTGVLSFVAAPDFETPADADADNVYDVTVEVSDGGLSDTQDLAVTVTNLNDNAPTITSDGGAATAAVNAAELATAVTTVTAADADGSSLTYSISGGADAALFQIDANTGALSFLAAPDFESPTDAGADNIYDVTVQVSDGSATNTQAIAVTVTDVNDNAPNITSNGGGATAGVNVAENTTAVTTVTASDADSPTLSFSISGGADAALFAVDAHTGALRFLTAPNFESPQDTGADNVYDVQVQVTDGSATDTQAITVTVTNANDNAPAITSDGGGASAGVNVAELTTAVSTVTAADADGSALTYSISGGADAALFQIDAATGALRFVAGPDFETPQDTGADNVYDVTVQVSDGSATDTQAIAVTVTDVNDNAPNITSNGGGASAALSLAENATAVTTVTASDADSPALSFSIAGGADAALFQIDANTGVLSFLATPDHESPQDAGANNVYDVTVRVSDGVLADTQSLAVTVTDVNDNAPAITSNGGSGTASVSIAENGTAVTTVTSADLDGPPPLYSITGGADAALFQIDSSTGALRFVTAPDAENPSDANADNVYDVTVQVADGSFSDTQAIAVTVTDANDIAPVITSGGGGASAAVQLAEGSSVVTTVAAVDADGPALTYSIGGGADAGRFTIDASTGVLRFIAAPDHEAPADANADNVYLVTVRASDGSLSTTQDIAVTLTDVNDNAPVITSDGGSAGGSVTAMENTSVVTTVTAVDADGPAVTYSIVGGADATWFTIDAATGVLTFTSARDAENPQDSGADNRYDVTVQASDGLLSTTQALSVRVGDADEFATSPVVDLDARAEAVDENAATGTVVGITARATDADASNNTITYSLLDDAGGRFTIDAASGVVTVADGSRLDYETATAYNLTVQGQSSDGSTSSSSFTVVLRDVNESVISPVRDTDAAPDAVPENAVNGSAVGLTAFAFDPDAGASVLYRLLDDAGGRFAIDAITGVVTVADASLLDHEAAASHTVRVQAESTDGTTTALSFTLQVGDVDEFDVSAIGNMDNQPNRVAEQAANGTPVGITAFAQDRDGTTSGITYTLRDDADGRFAIDPVTGVVTVADGTRLDYEVATSHRIEVLATSEDGSTSSAFFTVVLQPVGEHAPVITSFGGGDRAALQVASGQARVDTVTATDADRPAQTLVYTLEGGADAGRFTIDAASGLLQFAVAPQAQSPGDANGDNIYQVVVAVSDGQQSDRIALDVRVLQPAQVMPPDFVGGNGDAMLLGEAGRPQVATVRATDPANLPLVYAIVGGADAGHFGIDARTGALVFTTPPRLDAPGDADRDNAYEVVVQADNGSATRTKRLMVVLPSSELPTVPVAVMPTPANAGPLPPSIADSVAGNATGNGLAAGKDEAGGARGSGSDEDALGAHGDVLGTGPGALRAGGYVPDVSAHLRVAAVGAAGRMLALETVSWQGERAPGEPMALDIMSLLTLDSNFAPGPVTAESSGEGRGRITALPVATPPRAESGLSGIEVDAAAIATAAVTFGVVVWASRTGVLLASLLASTPAWQNFDPLPVLRRSARRRAQETPMPASPQDDGLDSMVPDSQQAAEQDPDDVEERMARHDPKAQP
jgi:hypothetical protein